MFDFLEKIFKKNNDKDKKLIDEKIIKDDSELNNSLDDIVIEETKDENTEATDVSIVTEDETTIIEDNELVEEVPNIVAETITNKENTLTFKSKESILKSVFGFDSFRENQEKIIDEILSGNNILSIMPTGSGKSLCYQIPAILLEGVTIVISPLISLMEDQILKLRNVGVECAFINSTLSDEEYFKIKKEIIGGKYTIIYIAPERLLSKDFMYIVSKLSINLVVVDEAHCVSQWGNDFRKSYLNINGFVYNINPKPVLAAFTATATNAVQEDIVSMLGLGECSIIKSSFDRSNLYIAKQYITNKNKDNFIINYLKSNKDKYGIIYCSTRLNVDELYNLLKSMMFNVAKYHAGMTDADRKFNQEQFIYDKINVIIATNAFGMGIDKPNVNYVIHYNCPKDIESYYQEIGRAGRDGTKAECILLYNGQDFNISKFLIDKTYDEEKNNNINQEIAFSVYQYKLEKLEKMKMLCHSNDCIKKYILGYFGEHRFENCNNCSVCENEFDEINVTNECSKILELVKTFNMKYGETTLSDVLKGSKSKKITGLGLSQISSYGCLNTLTISEIRDLFSLLLHEEYIYKTNSEYPTIGINSKGVNQLNSKENDIFLKKVKDDRPKIKNERIVINNDLIFKLKEVRLDFARKENVPAYIIFNDKTLENMCQLLPTSIEELLKVSGVGQYKADKYGEQFVSAIKEYIEKYDR